MKKLFGRRAKGLSPLGPAAVRRRVGLGREGAGCSRSPRYRVPDKDMGKIHKAASEGDVARVQHILMLGKSGVNDRDKKDRTALHFACAYGHPEVVTLLVERKCDIDARDSENSTALIKAVQCQEEECAAILLEHGADPNVMDASGNTALHYAVRGESISIAARLLLHSADTEMKNKDDLTPLLLGVKENKQEIVEFLVKKKASIHAVDELGSNRQTLFECDEERPKNSETSSPVLGVEPRASYMRVDKSSEDDSSIRRSNTPGPDDSWPTSDEDDYNFDNKNVPKVNFTELWTAAQQSKKNQANYDFGKLENRITFDSGDSNNENEDVVETVPQTSVRGQGSAPPSFLSPDPREGTAEPKMGKEENGTDVIESASQEQPNDDNLTYADGWHKSNRSEMMSALGLGEDEDEESPWDSEQSVSESLSLKCVGHLPEAAGGRGENRANGQVEGKSCISFFKSPGRMSEPDLEIISRKEQKWLNSNENRQLQVEEKRVQKYNKTEISENLCNGAADRDVDGLNQQNGKADQGFSVKESKERGWGSPALPLKDVKKKDQKWVFKESAPTPTTETADSLQLKEDSSLSEIKDEASKQISVMDDLDDLTQSSETSSEGCELPYPNYESILLQIEHLRMECKDTVCLLKIRDAIHSYKRLIEFKRSHCELLTGKMKRMENKFNRLQKELSESKEAQSQLEHEKVEWEQELSTLRFALKQEEERRRSADQLHEKVTDQLRKKEEQYDREVGIKQQLEISLRTLDMELKTVKNNLNQVLEERNDTQRQLSREQNARILQDGILANHLCKQKEIEMAQKKMTSEVSVSHEKEKDLLHKNQRLQDEIATLRLEMDTIRNHNQEKEKKYLDDIKVENEKNDKLQRMIKLNEETFTKTVFQYNGQLNILTTENTMLSSKLENEKQNKERLEAEIESYRSRLAFAVRDHDEIQTSKRDLEVAFQRARDEWLRLQDKLNFEISNLKDNNEILSQQLSNTERKFNSLEIEFHHTRDALREKTLVLKQAWRDLSQTQCQMKEVEHMYQSEQGKANKYIGKQESIQERLSQLQSENMLLRQQLDDANNKADNKEKTIVNIQDQFHDIFKRLQAESEKQSVMLEDRNKELIDECNHLKERMCQYENEKAEREVVVRDLQQELADTLKKQSMSEASLEVSSRYRVNLEDETRDLKKKLGQIRSQLEEAQSQHTDAVQCAERMQDRLQKFKKLLKMTKKELNEHKNKEFSLHQDIKTSQFENDMPTNVLKNKIDDLTAKLEIASSKCLHLDKKNQLLQEELLSMKTIQKRCGKLEKNKKKLEQEVVNLKSHMEKTLVELGQVEQYKREIEEKARQELVEKLKQVNLFLQTQAVSQENLEQLREQNTTSLRNQMELRIKDLESELSKMKTQEDFDKLELQKYKQLYQEEFKVRKSLSNKLNRTNERLEEASSKLLLEEQQNRSLLNTLSTRPVVACPCVGNFHNSLAFDGTFIPRENLVIPTSNLQPSNKRMEIFLTKMHQELEKSINRELK
ncbi:ankyrin repeat domain-containing protein 26, partial [Nannospalax galili]|uniref:ankyrin repeat domain-containing protein 26 n=1 Tax=Nannospalax galili TaxID=1026970 RepID=UPI00111C8B05